MAATDNFIYRLVHTPTGQHVTQLQVGTNSTKPLLGLSFKPQQGILTFGQIAKMHEQLRTAIKLSVNSTGLCSFFNDDVPVTYHEKIMEVKQLFEQCELKMFEIVSCDSKSISHDEVFAQAQDELREKLTEMRLHHDFQQISTTLIPNIVSFIKIYKVWKQLNNKSEYTFVLKLQKRADTALLDNLGLSAFYPLEVEFPRMALLTDKQFNAIDLLHQEYIVAYLRLSTIEEFEKSVRKKVIEEQLHCLPNNI